MNRYIVSGTVTVSCWTVVDAESGDDALKIASGREVAQINIDSSYGDLEFFHIDLDGTPTNLAAENADDLVEK